MGAHRGLQRFLDKGFSGLAQWAVRNTWVVIALALIALGTGLYGASLVRVDSSLETYFDEGDASYGFYLEYIDEFQSDEVIYLLYDAPGTEHGPFDMDVMRKIGHLTEALEREVPFTRKVTSLANVEFIESRDDTIEIRALLSEFPDTQEELLRVRDVALSKPLYVNALVSPDARYGAVVVEMSRTSTDPIERLRHDPDGGDDLDNLYPQVPNDRMREIIARPEYEGIRFWVSGDVPMNTTYNRVMTSDTSFMTVASLVLIALVSLVFFRTRVLGLFAPLAVVVLSLVLMVGFMGFAGLRINLFFLMIPPLLCAVGVAQCVHILYAWQQYRPGAANAADAVRAAIGKVGTPCLLAAATTAVAFLGMSVSTVRAIHELAFYTAFGVMCTFFLSLTLLVVFAARSRPSAVAMKRVEEHGRLHRLMDRIANMNIARPGLVLLVSACLLVVAGAGIARVQVNFNFLDEFRPSQEWRAHTEKLNDVMGGVLSVVYLFDTDELDGVRNSGLMQLMEGLQEEAESHPVVQSTMSVVDIVKELNQAFHGGDPAYYRLPEDSHMLSQLLLVYELSGGKEINDVLNIDRSKAALEVRMQMVPATEVRAFLQTMDAYIEANPLAAATIEVSGIGLLWVKLADYITATQLQGYTLVFGLITLMMIVAFGSVRVGLLSMIPNIFPIVVALGVMGWVGWYLDYLRLLLATIAIGIAVDDTVHMVARLRTEFAASGHYRTAVKRALHAVGPAITATTVILVVAVLSYLLSTMAVLASFGVLLAVAIFAALIADLFILPALVLMLKPFGPEREEAAELGELAVAASEARL